MGDFNKVISFVLGLIVVIVFLAVVTGRLNFRQRFASNNTKTTVTPTVTPTKKGFFSFLNKATPTPTTAPIIKIATPTPQEQPTVVTNYKNNQPMVVATPLPTTVAYNKLPVAKGTQFIPENSQPISSIPSTGTETILLPFALSSLAAGVMLRRIKK